VGHGVLPGTPEDNVRFFFETAKQADKLLAVAA
jgi:uroporphyrinogen decarboxylase